MYKNWLSEIKRYYPQFDRYGRPWTSFIPQTLIEENVWHDIRIVNLPFVPEFPVKNYFIDFADPVLKIGIEVDGRRWHTDIDKDKIRQQELEKLGWIIYRIQGWQTFELPYLQNCYCDMEEVCYCCRENERKYENSSENILRKIKKEHYQ